MGDPTGPVPETGPDDAPYVVGGLRPHHLDVIGGIVNTTPVAGRGNSPRGPLRARPARTRPLPLTTPTSTPTSTPTVDPADTPPTPVVTTSTP